MDEQSLQEYIEKTCFSFSPPTDPGCACGLPKGHEGRHHCTACDAEWDDWDEKNFDWSRYGT